MGRHAFCKGLDSEYFRLYGPDGLNYNVTMALTWPKALHTQMRVPVFNKTLFTNTGGWKDLAQGPYLLILDIEKETQKIKISPIA